MTSPPPGYEIAPEPAQFSGVARGGRPARAAVWLGDDQAEWQAERDVARATRPVGAPAGGAAVEASSPKR